MQLIFEIEFTKGKIVSGLQMSWKLQTFYVTSFRILDNVKKNILDIIIHVTLTVRRYVFKDKIYFAKYVVTEEFSIA